MGIEFIQPIEGHLVADLEGPSSTHVEPSQTLDQTQVPEKPSTIQEPTKDLQYATERQVVETARSDNLGLERQDHLRDPDHLAHGKLDHPGPTQLKILLHLQKPKLHVLRLIPTLIMVKARTRIFVMTKRLLMKLSMKPTLTVKRRNQDTFASSHISSRIFLVMLEEEPPPGSNWQTLVSTVPSYQWWNLKMCMDLLNTQIG
jgi:hypothetical protein